MFNTIWNLSHQDFGKCYDSSEKSPKHLWNKRRTPQLDQRRKNETETKTTAAKIKKTKADFWRRLN